MKNLMPTARTLIAVFLSGVLAVLLFFVALAELLDVTVLDAEWINWQLRQSRAYAGGSEALAATFGESAPPAVPVVIKDVLEAIEPTIMERVNAGTRSLARYLRGETESWDLALDGETLKRHAIDRVKVAIRHKNLPAVMEMSVEDRAALEQELTDLIRGLEIPAKLSDAMSPGDRQALASTREQIRWFHGGLLGLQLAALAVGLLLLWAGSFAWLAAVFALTGGVLLAGASMLAPYVTSGVARLGGNLPAVVQRKLPDVAAAFLDPLWDDGIAYVALGIGFLVLAIVMVGWRRFSTATRAAGEAAALPDATPQVRSKATFMRLVRWVTIAGTVLVVGLAGFGVCALLFPDEARVRQQKLRTLVADRDWPAAFDLLHGAPGPKPADFALLDADLQDAWLDFVEEDLRAGSAAEQLAVLHTKHDPLARHLTGSHAQRYRDLANSRVSQVKEDLAEQFDTAGRLAAEGDFEGAGAALEKLRPLAGLDPGFQDQERIVQLRGLLGAIERAREFVGEGILRQADLELASVQAYAPLAPEKYADAQLLIRYTEVEQRLEQAMAYADQGNIARAEAMLKQAETASTRAMQMSVFEEAFARLYPDLSFADRVAFQPDVLVATARAYVRQRRR